MFHSLPPIMSVSKIISNPDKENRVVHSKSPIVHTNPVNDDTDQDLLYTQVALHRLPCTDTLSKSFSSLSSILYYKCSNYILNKMIS